MSVPQPRLLETYNSLTDKHLVGYFSNARIRRHLQKSGLISRSGRIIPEKEYRLNAMRRDHQRHVLGCLANAISHKILDMERHHQREIKRRLEYSTRNERMQPVQVEQVRRSLEEVIHVHCPHPPLTPRYHHHELCPLAAGEQAACSQWRAPGLGVHYCCGHYPRGHRTREPALSKVSSLRPNTAPGNMQQPPHLQPLRGWAAARSVPKASKQKCHALEHDQQFACGGERNELRLLDSLDYTAGVSPYRLPVITRCPVPVPPPRLRRRRRRALTLRPEPSTAKRFFPTTGFNEQVLIRNTRGYPKSPLCSNAFVTMVYRGKSKHVSHREYKDEIRVDQQHCGTENICVYRGELLEGDTFQFTSKRHLGFPFSLTFYLNGLQVERLSSCCEYRYQRCSRLRGTNSYFRVLHVTGAPPCYRCITAMGLDKKLSPSKKRKCRCHQGKHVCCWGHAVHCHPCHSRTEQKSTEESLSVIIPVHETSMETVEETLETVEDSSEEETESQSSQESEESQPDTSHSEYDDDFEPDEEVNEEGQTGDQMNGMAESSSDDKSHNLDYGKESETSSQKALQASKSEKDESDGYSDDSGPEDDQQERRPADSLSSMSAQCSTETDSHAEMTTDNGNGKEDCNIKSTSDSAARAHYGNENGEKKLLRMEENQKTSAQEKKGIDEAEKAKPEALTAREDTRIFHENIMAMQLHSPEVNGEFEQAESGESDTNEEEKCPPMPRESRELNVEDGSEACPWCEEGGDCKLVQEEIAKATGNDHPVNSDPEPGDLCASEEDKNAANTEHDANGAPDGRSFLAEGKRSLDVQEAAGRAEGEGQGTGQGQPLEQDGAAEGGAGSREAGGEAAGAGDSLPQAGTGAALEESAPGEHPKGKGTGETVKLGMEVSPGEHPKGKGTGETVKLGMEMSPGEHPKGKGTGETVKLGMEVSPGEHEVLVEGMEREVALGKPAAGGEGPAGALPGGEAARAVPQGQEGAGGVTQEEEAAEEGLKGAVGPPAEEEVGELVPEAGESPGQGGSAGKDAVLGAVSEGEEPVEDADAAADGIARAVDPDEEDISEGQEAMGKPGALWEALGDVETGEAMPGEEGFVKPSEFSQLKTSGEAEWMEMGKAVAGAEAFESAQAWEVGGNEMEESVEPGKGPVRGVAPGLGALGGARGGPATEGSVQVEEAPAAQEEEGAAEALGSGNPSEGSEAETERAVGGKAEGEVVGGSAGAAGAGSGGAEEAAERAAGSKERAAGTEGWPGCGAVSGQGRSPGEGVLCGPRAGEPRLVAIAVRGGQAGPGAPGGAGTGAMAPEGVTGAARGAQSRTGAAVAREASARGRAAVGQAGRDGEGLADGAAAGGRAANREAAGGCEERGAGGREQEERESGTVRLGSARHGGVLATVFVPTAEASPSSPAPGDGRVQPSGTGSAGGEGLCPGTQPQLAAAGTARGRDGQEQGMEQAGAKAEGEQPSPCENARESEAAAVPESAGSAAGAGEQSEAGPVGASPGVPAAAGGGGRSRSPREDGANPDPLVLSSEQPQDGEETLL